MVVHWFYVVGYVFRAIDVSVIIVRCVISVIRMSVLSSISPCLIFVGHRNIGFILLGMGSMKGVFWMYVLYFSPYLFSSFSSSLSAIAVMMRVDISHGYDGMVVNAPLTCGM